MKHTIVALVAVVAVASPLAVSAADKERPARSDRQAGTNDDRAASRDEIRPHPGGLIEARWLRGRPVLNTQGREMGKVEEVWFDPKDGRIKEVVVAAGGFLGIGDKRSLVAWKDLEVAWENQKLIVRMDETALRSAQKYESPAASPATDSKKR